MHRTSIVFGVEMSKYLLFLPDDLHSKVKREARKHNMTMNDYIVTVLEQFLLLQARQQNVTKRDSS